MVKPDTFQGIFEKVLKDRLAELSPDELESGDVLDEICDSIPGAAEDLVLHFRTSLNKRSKDMLRQHAKFRRGFDRRHQKRWKPALALLETYLVVAYEVGEAFNDHYRPDAAAEQDFQFDALTRLHARSLQIADEVLCLLRHGYADGAHARWRTAHEVAVVATFLASSDQLTSEKYLKHEIVESYRAMTQYQKHCSALGQEVHEESEMLEIERLYDALCDKYGKPFGSPYGWASDALGKLKPNFADIENAAGLDHFRPYYKMASHNVHANSKGLRFKLGNFGRQEVLLTGASNYGLTDPAHGVALSILQTTSSLVNTRPNIDSIVMMKLLGGYCDDVGETFLQIQQRMEKTDAQQQVPSDV